MSGSSSDYSATATERPTPARQTSGDVLSYYFNDFSDPSPGVSRTPSTRTMEDTERTPTQRRQPSTKQRSPVAEVVAPSTGDDSAKVHRRRSSKTANAGDRRRLAIVEMDQLPTSLDRSAGQDDSGAAGPDVPQSQLLARRGMDQARLALVAPPDAAAITYTDLSPAPPISAPPRPQDIERKLEATSTTMHQRSKSNMEGMKTHGSPASRSMSSRDIGIVGAIRSPGKTPTREEHPGKTLSLDTNPKQPEVGLGLPPTSAAEDNDVAPIFQIPASRSPSPDMSSAASSTDRLGPRAPWAPGADNIITPAIGQSKELGVHVAPPVVTMLSGVSPHMTTASPPSAYTQSTSQHTSPSSSSPSSEYSQSAGMPYYNVTPQQYQYARFGPGNYINYDPVLHATAGPLPEPPRMAQTASLAPPPPRPPRLNTPRSRSPLKQGTKPADDKTQGTPTLPSAASQQASRPSPLSQPQFTAGPTPKASQAGFTAGQLVPTSMVQSVPLVRQMSDFSIAAVTVSSDSEQEPVTTSTAPSSEPAVSPSPRRMSSSEKSDSKHLREAAQSLPPSAFRRNSRSSEKAQSRSRQSSPVKPQSEPRSPTPEPKSAEEIELEAMLASMAPALVGGFSPSKTPDKRISPPVQSVPFGTAFTASPPLPALPLEAALEKLALQDEPKKAVVSPAESPPEVAVPASRTEAATLEDSASSTESSYVHASRPSTPLSQTTASPGQHSTRPSLSLALQGKGSNEPRSSSERSPSFSSSIGRFAGRAHFKAPGISSAWNTSAPKATRKAKATAAWPPAMRFDDVLRLRTPLDRAQGYARKINELAQVESGLSQWIMIVKAGPSTPDGPSKSSQLSTGGFAGGSRKVSGGSQMSDASFPTRPDATIATAIPSNDDDSPLAGAPANLPYPALAQGIGMRSQSTRTYNSSTLSLNTTTSRSISSGPLSGKKTGGFFSSIGRRNSTRKDRNLPLPNPNPLSRQASSPLTGMGPGPQSPTRAMRPMAAPTIPGGPRAPPGRLQKANNLSRRSSVDSPVVISPPLQTTPLDKRRSVGHAALGQYTRPVEAQWPMGGRGPLDETSSHFSASLQKMADILPQANRTSLARYLTDANGEEMLAITRYIEDEKRGGVKY